MRQLVALSIEQASDAKFSNLPCIRHIASIFRSPDKGVESDEETGKMIIADLLVHDPIKINGNAAMRDDRLRRASTEIIEADGWQNFLDNLSGNKLDSEFYRQRFQPTRG